MRGNYTRVNLQYQKGMSSTEKRHLAIAITVLTLAFAILFSRSSRGIFSEAFLLYLPQSFLAVVTAFLFHELAHRKLARNYGCWAEFRMWRWGLILALMFSFVGFVFAAPGAVMIRGNITKEQNGKISAAGPAMNWAVGSVFLIGSIFALIYEFFFLTRILSFVAYVNLFLGGFNLLPFGPLDGRKIFSWSVKSYLILAALIGGTLALGFYLNLFIF